MMSFTIAKPSIEHECLDFIAKLYYFQQMPSHDHANNPPSVKSYRSQWTYRSISQVEIPVIPIKVLYLEYSKRILIFYLRITAMLR